MTHNHLTRLAQVIVLTAAFAVPATALGDTNPGTAAPDVFERYAAAHPYNHGILDPTQASDALERYAATHAPTAVIDGRSPDTRDAAEAARFQLADRRSPDTRDAAAAAARLQHAGGNPTATSAAKTAQSTDTDRGDGFNWGDAAVGAIVTAMLIVLIGAAVHLLARSHPRLVANPTRGTRSL